MKHLQQTILSMMLACLIVAPVQAATQMYFIHNDHLGTPQVVTDQSQAVVWQGHQTPFGVVEETTATIEQLSRFPGQYFDEESGLSYNYFRDYDPTIGRYIQSDPIGLRGGINTYAYVGGNPVIFLDSFGLACFRLDTKKVVECSDLMDKLFPEESLPGDEVACMGNDLGACARDLPVNEIASLLCYLVNLEVGSCKDPFNKEDEESDCAE